MLARWIPRRAERSETLCRDDEWSHRMSLVHRLVGYDRCTDRMKARCDIPRELLAEAKRIAGVGSEDPDAAWSYPLSAAQARAVAQLIGTEFDPSGLEFFLELFADSGAGDGTRS